MQTAYLVVSWAVIFLFTVTFHEVAHGAVAYIRGDRTAKAMGRLTLNPFRHIDWFWTLLFPFTLFIMTGGRFMIGMAKPVPVNFTNLYRPKLDMILVAIAGPIANLIFAQFLVLLYRLTGNEIFLLGTYLNLGLAVFNLLPLPPMDGSRIVTGFLPKPLDDQYLKLEPYGFVIVLILYMMGFLQAWIIPGVNLLAALFHIPRITV